MRMQDAIPDEIAVIRDEKPTPLNKEAMNPGPGDKRDGGPKSPVPRTVVTRVDSSPVHGAVPGTKAYKMRTMDAEPDQVEKKGDVPSK